MQCGSERNTSAEGVCNLMTTATPSASKVFGPFEVLAKIGRGANAEVYKVRHRPSGKVAALKVTSRFLELSAEAVERFHREYTVIRPMRHPNIVRAVGCGEHDGMQYLAMEYVPGQNLEDRLKEKGPLSTEDAIAIFSQIADGVRYLHDRQIVHRDIKPSNVLLTPSNQAKLGDFGLLKNLAGDENLTQWKRSMGTIEYGAPEQFEDAKRVDQRCDLYSLAGTLYTTLTGKFPFGNGGQLQILQRKFLNQFVPLRLLVPRLDPALDQIVNGCLRSNPAERPSRCDEFQAVLRNYCPQSTSKASTGADIEARRVKGRDRRAVVRFAVDLTTTFVPFHQNMRGRWESTILDASPKGVRIRTPRSVAVNSVLQLTMGSVGRTELALVRWVKSGKDNTQILGCSFIRPLSEAEFKDLYLPGPNKTSK
jgi:serine/threonine protein kinase